MAIEVISPRISFSYYLNAEAIEEHHHHHHHQSSDFVFNFGDSFVQELSPADELFSNGKILPMEIKKKPVVAKPVPVPSPPKKRLKEFLSMSIDDADDQPEFKSLWQFKRSISLNSGTKTLIRSLHFLSRSNSTGSASNPKPTMLSKETEKQHLQKQPSLSTKSSHSHSSGAFYAYTNSTTHKSPLKSSNCGSYGNGVGVNSVLISNVSVLLLVVISSFSSRLPLLTMMLPTTVCCCFILLLVASSSCNLAGYSCLILLLLLCWLMLVDVVAMFASLLSPLTAVLPGTLIVVSMPLLKRKWRIQEKCTSEGRVFWRSCP
ncbi:hypothetical protein PVK06_031432 [Gossypium arboreum]|uniref:Uncharacterized protein n=1 Tax=Gossypium arboreum TaxID=29729 RepID=A0ABR0NU84_GOSAR|nr:hypothetical protein PVK06_031432 [Gossypium arboreum]